MHPQELRYSPEHIWVKDEGNGRYRTGVTYHYQEQIKSVVFLELHNTGSELKRGEPFGALESSKVSTDLISPMNGSVVETNSAVIDKPGLVNRDPYGLGWLMVIHSERPDEIRSLLSAKEYLASASSGSGGGPCQP